MQSPPRIRHVPDRTPLWLAAALATGAGVVILFFFDPARWPFYPACMFHRVTGLNCPGCGGLRALHQLVHGHLASALHFNAFAVLGTPALVGMAVCAWWRTRRGAEKRQAVVPPTALWLLLAVAAGFGILRNLPFPQCAWLSP